MLTLAIIAALTCLALALIPVRNIDRTATPYTLPLRTACLALGHACLAVKHAKNGTPKAKPLQVALAMRTQARHDLIMAQLQARGYYN